MAFNLLSKREVKILSTLPFTKYIENMCISNVIYSQYPLLLHYKAVEAFPSCAQAKPGVPRLDELPVLHFNTRLTE